MATQTTQRNRGKSAPPPFVLLHRNKSRTCQRGLMLRWAQVALALLVAFTIAYILITPNTRDDVAGILQQNHPASPHRILAGSFWEFQTPLNVLLHFFTFPARIPHLTTFA